MKNVHYQLVGIVYVEMAIFQKQHEAFRLRNRYDKLENFKS